MKESNISQEIESQTSLKDDIIQTLFDKEHFLNNEFENEKKTKEKIAVLDVEQIFEKALERESPYFSALFDYDYYTHQSGLDLKPYDALIHFLTQGFLLGYNPNYLFSTHYYLDQNEDVKEAGINPLMHFISSCKTEYRDPHPLYSVKHYCTLYPDIHKSKMNPLGHYIEHGYKENRIPHPLFISAFIRKRYGIPFDVDILKSYMGGNEYNINKTHPFFDGEYYTKELGKERMDVNPLQHYLNNNTENNISTSYFFDSAAYIEENELSEEDIPLLYFELQGKKRGQGKLNHISSEIQDQISKAIKLEPSVAKPNRRFEYFQSYALPPDDSIDMLLLKAVLKDLQFSADIIFLISTMRRGGAEIFTMKILKSILKNTDKKVLLIYTDATDSEADEWLPEHKNFAHIDIHKLESFADMDARHRLLNHLISASKPEFVLNTNSRVGWELYKNYGKSLHKITKLDACLFCYDYDQFHNKAGYPPEYFRQTIGFLNKVITDNQSFVDELIVDYGLSENEKDKLVVLNQPPDLSIGRINRDSLISKIRNNFYDKKPIVLWASRMVTQKRPDILVKIADQLPNVDFHVWGKGNIYQFLDDDMDDIPENIILKGPYNNLTDIHYQNATIFLHTCSWDGVPTMLLDMINIGFPVVAPDIGGISNLVNDETGWLIEEVEDIEAYVDSIEEIIQNSGIVNDKLSKAEVNLFKLHGQTNFDSNLKIKLNYLN